MLYIIYLLFSSDTVKTLYFVGD